MHTFLIVGQKQSSGIYKEHVIVDFKQVEVFYGKKLSKEIKTSIIYNDQDKIISFQKSQKDSISEVRKADEKLRIKANLKVVDNKIILYPWFFEKNDTLNKFFKDNVAYIKMEERVNYSFPYRAFSIGATTLPIKWYMKSDLGNVETSLNAMIMLGYRFGKERYVKFPVEEKVREYKSLWSINLLFGLSKIELNESNLKSGNTYEGDVAAFSTGLSIGKHYGNFSFLVASGFDLPTSNSNDWKFSGTPWLGLGFGYSLF